MKSLPRINGAPLGFEQKLWSSADKLRSNMDAAEYKHVVLGLIFIRTYNNLVQSQNLSQIRDSLLLKLMSGKIRVPVEVKNDPY